MRSEILVKLREEISIRIDRLFSILDQAKQQEWTFLSAEWHQLNREVHDIEVELIRLQKLLDYEKKSDWHNSNMFRELCIVGNLQAYEKNCERFRKLFIVGHDESGTPFIKPSVHFLLTIQKRIQFWKRLIIQHLHLSLCVTKHLMPSKKSVRCSMRV
jgi:hypothetical protein